MYTLLVVDDERWIRMGIVKMIDRDTLPIGQVYEAATVRDAKALYHQRHPDIVLTDVCFPAENGCDFGEYIYRDDPTVRIVMISAYSEFSYAQQALRFRAANYLLKPVSKETLNQVVAQCIRELETLRPAAPTPPEVPDEEEAYSVEIVRKIADRLCRDCAQKVSLSQLAKEYHINEAYLSYVFKKEMGLSLTNYLLQIRMEEACRLLAQEREKLRTVARRVGYEDYQYFVRVFKKSLNVTPSEYQARIRAEKENPHGQPSHDPQAAVHSMEDDSGAGAGG